MCMSWVRVYRKVYVVKNVLLNLRNNVKNSDVRARSDH